MITIAVHVSSVTIVSMKMMIVIFEFAVMIILAIITTLISITIIVLLVIMIIVISILTILNITMLPTIILILWQLPGSLDGESFGVLCSALQGKFFGFALAALPAP